MLPALVPYIVGASIGDTVDTVDTVDTEKREVQRIPGVRGERVVFLNRRWRKDGGSCLAQWDGRAQT